MFAGERGVWPSGPIQLLCGEPGGGGLLVSRVAPSRVDSQTQVDRSTAEERPCAGKTKQQYLYKLKSEPEGRVRQGRTLTRGVDPLLAANGDGY